MNPEKATPRLNGCSAVAGGPVHLEEWFVDEKSGDFADEQDHRIQASVVPRRAGN